MDGKKTDFLEVVPMCLGAMLASVILLKVVTRLPERPLLDVGDIIEFDATRRSLATAGGVVEAARDDRLGQPCALEAEAIHRSGASMIVTRVEADLSGYGIHWVSEGPTSDLADCGRDAWLTVGRETLMELYSTADRANGHFIVRDGDEGTGISVALSPAGI